MTARDYRQFILQRFLPLSEQAEQDGAALIAWPEASFPDEFPAHPNRLPPLGLPPLHAQLLIGGVTFGTEHGRHRLTNSAFASTPNGEIVGQYDKHHLVPFGEYVPLEKALHVPRHRCGGARTSASSIPATAPGVHAEGPGHSPRRRSRSRTRGPLRAG